MKCIMFQWCVESGGTAYLGYGGSKVRRWTATNWTYLVAQRSHRQQQSKHTQSQQNFHSELWRLNNMATVFQIQHLDHRKTSFSSSCWQNFIVKFQAIAEKTAKKEAWRDNFCRTL